MIPGSLLYFSSKEYTRYPLKNKLNNDSMSSSVADPSNTTFSAQRNNIVAEGISLAKCRNEEMKLKPSPSLSTRKGFLTRNTLGFKNTTTLLNSPGMQVSADPTKIIIQCIMKMGCHLLLINQVNSSHHESHSHLPPSSSKWSLH